MKVNFNLSPEDFEKVIDKMSIQEKSIEIAYAVIVDGKKQSELAEKHNISRAAVNKLIQKIKANYEKLNIPAGYEEITVILPADKAYIVKQWAKNKG